MQNLGENRNHILKIRCSDGLTRKPDELRANIIHEIRLPGGILFPDLCAQQSNKIVVSKLLRRVLHYAIEVMIGLKNPKEIILMAHQPCGAANAIGMTPEEVEAAHEVWRVRLQKRFPQVPVRVFTEQHSACGQHHWGHREICRKELRAA